MMMLRFMATRLLFAVALLVLPALALCQASDKEAEKEKEAAAAAQSAAPVQQARPGNQRPGGGRQVEGQVEGQQAPAATGEQPPQRGRRPGRGGQQAGGAPAGGGAPPASSFGNLGGAVDANARLLRLHPEGAEDRVDQMVLIGDEFTTELTFLNPDRQPFDQLRVTLSFEPDFIEPISINDSLIAPYLKGEPKSEVDTLYGLITYEAETARPAALSSVPILKIRWKAKKITYSTRIDFANRDGLYTTMNFEGRDLLGSERTPGDGTLNMAVTVIPRDQREAEAMLTAPRVFSGPDEKIGGVRLFLTPPEGPVIVGKPFSIDVVLDNRANSMLDGLGLLIEFDPSTIEILDADLDNWITRGRNILDGPFRIAFPWDFHIANTIYPSRGLISYRVGSGDGEMTRGRTGPVARIHAVARKPTSATTFLFKFSRRERTRATEVTYIGQDVLGDPKAFGDGTRGVVFSVGNAPDMTVAGGSSSGRSASN